MHPAGAGDWRRNLLGWLSLGFGVLGAICCGCLWWFYGFPLVGAIPALVLGILHLQKVRKGEATSAWLGWVGIVLGALALIGAIVGLTAGDDMRSEYDRRF